MTSWVFCGKRQHGDVDIATIYGQPISDELAKRVYGGELTRHHMIDIQTLQEAWNTAVGRNDRDTLLALAMWAGVESRLPSGPWDMWTTKRPDGVLKGICWNTFNVVIGPSVERRIGDPGGAFDTMSVHSFPAFTTKPPAHGGWWEPSPAHFENIGLQEWNTHVDRLRRIALLLDQYITLPKPTESGYFVDSPTDEHDQKVLAYYQRSPACAPALVASLRTLLRSDTPRSYPRLYGGALLGGSLLSPRLWIEYAKWPNTDFIVREPPVEKSKLPKGATWTWSPAIAAADRTEAPRVVDPRTPSEKKFHNVMKEREKLFVQANDELSTLANKAAKGPLGVKDLNRLAEAEKKVRRAVRIVPWVSASYFGDLRRVKPVPQFEATRETLVSEPTQLRLETWSLKTPAGRQMLDRATCLSILTAAFAKHRRWVDGAGVRVVVAGPPGSPFFADALTNVSQVIDGLAPTAKGRVTWVALDRHTFDHVEVRLYVRA